MEVLASLAAAAARLQRLIIELLPFAFVFHTLRSLRRDDGRRFDIFDDGIYNDFIYFRRRASLVDPVKNAG